MARKLRIENAGAIYHVRSRGDRRVVILEADRIRERFLETLAEACQKTNWQMHADCLMRNHFHLLLETPQPKLVVGRKWLLGTDTSRHNRRPQEFGHLFSGRYQALVVDGSGNGYRKTVCDYVHLNPARAHRLRPSEPLSDFSWSSYPLYRAAPAKRPGWLRADRLLGEWGIPNHRVAGRRVFGARMEPPRRENLAAEFMPVERGWCLGGEPFRQELLAQVRTAPGASHFGEAVPEAAAAPAEQRVVAGLKRLGWNEARLQPRRKGDASKVALANELRAGTTVPLTWIQDRRAFGHGQPEAPGLAVKPTQSAGLGQIEMTRPAAYMALSLTDPVNMGHK